MNTLNTLSMTLPTAPLHKGATPIEKTADKSTDAVRKAAMNLEAVFISHMLRPLFEEIGSEQPFGNAKGEEIWRTMQIDEYGKAIAKSGGIGLSDSIVRQMLQYQEAKTNE